MIPAALGALLIGISLGLLGSGGSILTVPCLVYLVGQPEKVAIAGSLAIVGTISLVGSVPYSLRRQVHWQRVLWFGVPGMIGTVGGARLSTFVSGGFQLGLFAVVMLLAAALMLRPIKLDPAALPRKAQAAWRICADGLFVGVLTGLVGVGGGFLIIPALVILGGLEMTNAVGTSLVIIAMKSFSGFLKYLDVLREQNVRLDPQVIALFIVVGIAGSLIGERLSTRVPQERLKQAFGALLVLMSSGILLSRIS